MKHSRGILTGSIIPLLIVVCVAIVGWYLYFSEKNKNESVSVENISQLEQQNMKLEGLAAEIERLKQSEASLQGSLNTEQQLQKDLATLLEVELDKSETSLKALLTEKTAVQERLALRQESNRKLTTQFDELMQETTALIADMEIEQESNRKLKTQVSELNQETVALVADLAVERKSNRKMTAQRDELMQKSTALVADFDKKQHKFNQLMSENISFQQTLTEYQAKTDTQNNTNQQLTQMIEILKTEKQTIASELEQEVNRVNMSTAELEAELEHRSMAEQSLSARIDTVSGEKTQLLTQLEREQKSKRKIANLKNRLEQELNESRVEISHLKNQMTVIKLTSEVLFSSGSAKIKPAGRQVLSIIAESLNSYPNRAISIEGHTDDIPVLQNVRYQSNWDLSAARGLAAVHYFQDNSQVDPGRLRVVGYSQYRPVASNSSANGRGLNRRIEIRLLAAESN